MLTADLVRATSRDKRVYPRYIDPTRADLVRAAEGLIAMFDRAYAAEPKWSKAQINDAVDELVGMETDPLFFRGLLKLLEDRCKFATSADIDPVDLRRQVFTLAAKTTMRRTPGSSWVEKRQDLLRSVADDIGLSADEVSEFLFADLDARQRLVKFSSLEPAALLHRYNLGLAQAVLIRATRLKITLKGSEVGAYRQVFRALKFHQLIHRIHSQEDGHTTIEVDGPLSLFSNAKRYGVAMARFLPTLVLSDRWCLEADLVWGKEKLARRFELDHRRGLRSHLKKKGQYITSEQEIFEDRFGKKPGDWEMSRTAELLQARRGDVIVPDLQFRHRDTGKRAYLEIIGFWRAGSLANRLEQLEDPGLQNLIIGVSRKLAGDQARAELEHPRLVWFSKVISAPQVADRLNALNAAL